MPIINDPLFTHNLRSEKQWDIITEHVDFSGKKVIDYGCGYADILRRALILGGAEYCAGVEEDWNVVKATIQKFPRGAFDPSFRIFNENAEEFVTTRDGMSFDVGVCFAVLPYLGNADDFLHNMSSACLTALIECQYVGDGPGNVFGDKDMEEWLGCHSAIRKEDWLYHC